MKYSKDDILSLVIDNDVKFIRLQFVDIVGNLKNMAITVSQLEKALDNKCMFDGSAIVGFTGVEESDMYLYPDLDTFTVFPWRPQQGKVARFICDIYNPDGTIFEGYPRYILKKAVKRAEELGYVFNVGPECEFFLFRKDDNGNITTIPHDNGTYFDLGPVDMGENTRREICLTLEDMGFEVESTHHEMAGGQHEIDIKYDDALKAADNILTLKLVVKTVAQRNGLYATFMPKPSEGVHGSGMHINMSLSKDGRNVFADSGNKNGLSKEAYSFIAGILKHIKGITAVTNPTVNSYKRLVPGFDAPTSIAWSDSNRSQLVRIPSIRGELTRVELRSPDLTCNPYLALALMLNAGLDGIENNLVPPSSVDKDMFHMNEEELIKAGIDSLPSNLGEAIEEMEKDEIVKNTLGEHVYNKYIELKKKEWLDYSRSVSEWEIKNYLGSY